MPAKRRFRFLSPTFHAGRRAALLAVAAVIAALAFGPTPSLANTGSVYYDSNANVGAGHDSFNGAATGYGNVGLEYSVMKNLTTGSHNVAIGDAALLDITSGNDNVATGYQAL